MRVVDRPVEILSLKWVSVVVIFAVHYLVIVLITSLHIELDIFKFTFRTNWCSFFPEILIMSVKFQPLILSVAWGSVLVSKSICVLVVATSFVEELPVLGMVMRIIFTFGYM